jgi:putative heme-binding domain-containing protein
MNRRTQLLGTLFTFICLHVVGARAADGIPASTAAPPYDAAFVRDTASGAMEQGNAERGMIVFAAAKSACLSCHRVREFGGSVGASLTEVGKQRTTEQIVESVFWPRREVKPEFVSYAVLDTDGILHRGYKQNETDTELTLRDPTTGTVTTLSKDEIDAVQETGTLMPDGLTNAMTRQQQLDLVRFLSGLGRDDGIAGELIDGVLQHAYVHAPASFPYDFAPLHPEDWPHRDDPVNRNRLYDFYTKEAEYFRGVFPAPPLVMEYPGLDGGSFGHWGNQNEDVWADGRWNDTLLGSMQCGVFRGAGQTIARGVCLQLGESGEVCACFDPDTLTYRAVWSGGFVGFSPVRHGFMHGLLMQGKPLPLPRQSPPDEPFVYHGFYRHGPRVILSYRIGDTEYLDAPWVEDGQFVRDVAPAAEHPLKHLTEGGPQQWPQVIETPIVRGTGSPYAIDTITLPFDNPWHALIFCGGHDFLPDGSALICTMQGDVWHVSGLDGDTAQWRRFASGLHFTLGLIVDDDGIFVLGRNQITRLRDLNGDGEADFYECFSNAYETSPAGHDFICGLQRDARGRFYTATGNQGLMRISADGRSAELLATGFRNPDGLGLDPQGIVTIPCSEGEWTPASMIRALRPDAPRVQFDERIGGQQPPFFGYGGPRDGRAPELPLVYLPRGLDNSAGAEAYIDSDRWGPFAGRMVHFSFGSGTHFLLLRDEVDGVLQGGVVPLPGDFASGVHRGRFNPVDGQLYVSGMAGWGTYTVDDGCFQRVRFTGERVQAPVEFHVHENGVLIEFTQPLDLSVAEQTGSHFAQCWNYLYSGGYGSAEYSTHHPGVRGHDVVPITAAHVVGDGRSLFLEIPELQPVNQLYLRMHVDDGDGHDLFLTVHRLDGPFSDYPGYQRVEKVIDPHPILADLALATLRVPNPWRNEIRGARSVRIEAGPNLSYNVRSFTVQAGEPIRLTFANPDVVPHNWTLAKRGALQRVGELANHLVGDPEAYARHYIPQTDDVLAYTDIVLPQEEFSIYFRAPKEPGRYPYLCTFPGHWMVMNGEMIVK